MCRVQGADRTTCAAGEISRGESSSTALEGWLQPGKMAVVKKPQRAAVVRIVIAKRFGMQGHDLCQ